MPAQQSILLFFKIKFNYGHFSFKVKKVETIFSNHHQYLKKHSFNLERQKQSLQAAFTEYHITWSKLQNLVENNLKTMGFYRVMVDGLNQAKMGRSLFLECLEVKDQKMELLPLNSHQIEMKIKSKQIQDPNEVVIKKKQSRRKNNDPEEIIKETKNDFEILEPFLNSISLQFLNIYK